MRPNLPGFASCPYELALIRRGSVRVCGWLAGYPAADSTRVAAVRRSNMRRYGPLCDLDLPAIRTVLTEQPGLQKDFAESIQGICDVIVHPGFATAQHFRNFVTGERVQPDEGDHLGVLLAKPGKTQLDVANEDRLIFKAGSSVMRDPSAKKLPS